MNRCAVINAAGLVVNVILLNDQEEWTPPRDCKVRKLEEVQRCGPGYTFKDGDFIAPPEAD